MHFIFFPGANVSCGDMRLQLGENVSDGQVNQTKFVWENAWDLNLYRMQSPQTITVDFSSRVTMLFLCMICKSLPQMKDHPLHVILCFFAESEKVTRFSTEKQLRVFFRMISMQTRERLRAIMYSNCVPMRAQEMRAKMTLRAFVFKEWKKFVP